MSDQSESSAVYNILAFAFEGQDTAGQIVKEINPQAHWMGTISKPRLSSSRPIRARSRYTNRAGAALALPSAR